MSSSRLVPRDISEFRKKSYWDKFFTEREKSFEWYGDWSEIQDVVPRYCEGEILIAGCGNSALSEKMYDLEFDCLSVDYSQKVIKEMKKMALKKGKKDMRFQKMDLRDLGEFENERFGTVLDKACLDAVLTDDSDEVVSDVNKILDEQIRVLKTGGCFIIVTLAQDHVVSRLRERFHTGFSANVHWIPTRSPLSTFLFAFRKLENVKATTTYKICFASDAQKSASNHVIRSLLSSSDRMVTVDNPTSYVTNLQHATYSYRILGEHGQGVRFDTSLTPVVSDEDEKKTERNTMPKYELSVIDRKSGGRVSGSRCAVLLIPPSRFRDWNFANPEGQVKLCEDQGFSRMIIVRMHPSHNHNLDESNESNFQSVQNELSPLVYPLALSSSRKSKEKILYVKVATDENDKSRRKRIFELNSKLSGPIVVEDMIDEKRHKKQRVLIFLESSNHIQSETMVPFDHHEFLHFEIHRAMIASLCLLSRETLRSKSFRGCVVGLGGGMMCMFMRHHWQHWHCIDAVEIDRAVVSVAKSSFGFQETKDRLDVHIEDGVKFLCENVKEDNFYDVVFIDCNASDAMESPMAFPPATFLTKSFLKMLRRRCKGIVVMNVSCRSPSVYASTLERMRSYFGTVKELRLQTQTLNRLVVMSGDSDLSALSFESFCDTTTITSSSKKTWSDEMNSELSRLVSGIDGEDTTNTKRKKKKKKKKKSKKKNRK